MALSEVFPRKYGRYRLLGLLGAGGMGIVYRAESEPVAGITRTVAIKRMLTGSDAAASEDELIQMLLDEARIWVRLQHPNIVSVVDFGRESGDWYLALELIDGITVQDLVDTNGKLAVPEALCIVERVARALHYAHTLSVEGGKRLHIVHRDVKPANILLSMRGEVKLTDFGIARATDRRTQTEAGQLRGSLRVMSPEQVLGAPLDARSDLFSLGCTLHEFLTGKALLAGSRSEVLTALSTKKIPAPDASLPPAVRELIARLTAAEPARRPANADEVARQARAMLLPETVEDVETAIGVSVRRVRAGATSTIPAAGPTGDPGDTTAPRIVNESAIETEPAFREIRAPDAPTAPLPPGARPAKPWERPAAPTVLPEATAPARSWTFHARIGLVILGGLVLAWGSVRWVTCSQARLALTRARAGTGTLEQVGDVAGSCMRYCGATAERRIAVAAGSFLGGKTSADAAAGLGSSPEEQRFGAVLRVASRGWAPASARTEALALPSSPEASCLAAVLAYNAGTSASVEIPDGAVGSACANVLAISEELRAGRLERAEALIAKLPASRAPILASAVALSLNGTAPAIESKIAAALRTADEEVTGVWVPSSWTLLAGERGRLTTPLDDVAALGAMLAGDARARAGDFTGAVAFYRKAEARGWKHPDLIARQIDLYLHARRLDDRGTFVRDRAVLGATAVRLAITPDARLGSTDGLAARVALAHLASSDPASAEKALAQIRSPELAATIAADIARVRRRPPSP